MGSVSDILEAISGMDQDQIDKEIEAKENTLSSVKADIGRLRELKKMLSTSTEKKPRRKQSIVAPPAEAPTD